MGVFEFGVTYEGWFVTVCFLSFRIQVVGSALKMPRLYPPVTCAEDAATLAVASGGKDAKSIAQAEASADGRSTSASSPLDWPR